MWRHGGDAFTDAGEKAAVPAAEDTAAEDDLKGSRRHSQPPDGRVRGGNHLIRELFYQPARHLVAMRRRLEDHWRELHQPALLELADVYGLHHRGGPRHAEVLGHQALELGARAAPVASAQSDAQRGGAKPSAAMCPVPGHLAK